MKFRLLVHDDIASVRVRRRKADIPSGPRASCPRKKNDDDGPQHHRDQVLTEREGQLDGDEHRDRLAKAPTRKEAPRLGGLDGLLVQAEHFVE